MTIDAQALGASIHWHSEHLTLLPQRAIHWPAGKTVFVADVHLGKVEAFQRGGIPVPAECGRADLRRLGELLDMTAARTLVILGDLFHARSGMVPEMLEEAIAWRRMHAGVRVLLVRGNHDARAGEWPGELAIEPLEEGTVLGPFALRHHPLEQALLAEEVCDGPAVLCGHIHPAVLLAARRGRGGSSMRVPCFWAMPQQMVLPAFGRFTGCKRITPRAGDRVFAVGPSSVLETSLA